MGVFFPFLHCKLHFHVFGSSQKLSYNNIILENIYSVIDKKKNPTWTMFTKFWTLRTHWEQDKNLKKKVCRLSSSFIVFVLGVGFADIIGTAIIGMIHVTVLPIKFITVVLQRERKEREREMNIITQLGRKSEKKSVSKQERVMYRNGENTCIMINFSIRPSPHSRCSHDHALAQKICHAHNGRTTLAMKQV